MTIRQLEEMERKTVLVCHTRAGLGQEPDRSSRLKRLAVSLAVFLALWLSIFIFQRLGGVYDAEFGSSPDEAAHYITGLMVRDYLAAGIPGPPMRYAESYYLHYPKVALGHWPPVFYVLQAIWGTLVGPSRSSILVLMSLIVCLLGFEIFRLLRSKHGAGWGLLGAAIFVSLPIVQSSAGSVMSDGLVALLLFWATLAFYRFLSTERTSNALGFGLLASLAILTKGSGIALAFLPGIAVVFTKRWWIFRSASFWLPPLVVAVLCGPWYLATSHMAANGFGTLSYAAFIAQAAHRIPQMLVEALGVPLLAAALGGLFFLLFRGRLCDATNNQLLVLLALASSVIIMNVFIPATLEPRLLLSVTPPFVIFCVHGLVGLRQWTSSRRVAGLLVATGFFALFTVSSVRIHKKPSFGWDRVAAHLLSLPDLRNTIFLVSSEANGEGMLISEVAMREERPGHIILRASKVLASSDWIGSSYKLTLQTPEDVMQYLASIPVAVVVLDETPGPVRLPHHALLQSAIAKYPSRWEMLNPWADGFTGAARPRIYRLAGPLASPVGKVRVSLRPMLDRVVEY